MTEDLFTILGRPTCNVDEFRRIFGLSKNGAYEALKRRDFVSIRVGRSLRVPTAPLRRALGVVGLNEGTKSGGE